MNAQGENITTERDRLRDELEARDEALRAIIGIIEQDPDTIDHNDVNMLRAKLGMVEQFARQAVGADLEAEREREAQAFAEAIEREREQREGPATVIDFSDYVPDWTPKVDRGAWARLLDRLPLWTVRLIGDVLDATADVLHQVEGLAREGLG